MKKLFSLLSVILCVAILTTSFSAALPDPYTISSKAMKALDTATSLDLTATTTNNIIIDGEKLTDKSTVKIKMVYVSRNKVHLQMTIKGSDGSEYTIYYKDGYAYLNMYGMKSRHKMDMDDIFDSVSSLSGNITKANLKNAKIESVDAGYKVRFLIKSDTVSQTAKNNMLDSLKAAGLTNPKMTLSDFQTTLVISKDGQLKSFSEAFSSNVAAKEGKFTMQSVSTFKVNSINKLESIKFPSDLSSYTKY